MKDPLSSFRKTIRHQDRKARATVARIKRGVLITFAALGGLGVLLLQMGAGECRGGAGFCGDAHLNAASIAPTSLATTPSRPNAAMAAALAARAAAERAAARQPVAAPINPARAAALRAAQGRQQTTAPSGTGGGRAVYFTDAVAGR